MSGYNKHIEMMTEEEYMKEIYPMEHTEYLLDGAILQCDKTTQSGDMVELVIESREIFQLGDMIPYNGIEYFICTIQTSYQDAECIHKYFLRTKEALKVLPTENKALQGCSFDAVITDVCKDKVQVEIVQDEWKAADGKKWFLYSAVYSLADGTGWYCMSKSVTV